MDKLSEIHVFSVKFGKSRVLPDISDVVQYFFWIKCYATQSPCAWCFCSQKKCCTCFLFYFLSNYNLKDVSELPNSDTVLAMTIENRTTKRNERYIIFIAHLFFRLLFTFFRIQLFNSLLFSIKDFFLNERKLMNLIENLN